MKKKRPHRTGAIQSVELLLILPIVLVIMLGVVEFSLILAAEARFQSASREGARVAAVGGSPTEIKAAVEKSLPKGEFCVVEIQYDLYSDPPANTIPKVTGDIVAVKVQAAACKVVPDLLRFVGISICSKCIEGQTAMRKE